MQLSDKAGYAKSLQPVHQRLNLGRRMSHRTPFRRRLTTVATLLFILLSIQGRSQEWQWSALVTSVISLETNDHPRAFLWIPPKCERIRGVVVGQHNMEEEPILEHRKFRAALEELNFAAVWVTPAFDPFFRFDRGAGEHFDAMMKALADESGYTELALVPVVPIGHSAAASFPWSFAAWNPARTLAAISISGQWPLFKDPTMPDWGSRTIDGVPGLVTMGEYEWADQRATEGLKQRAQNPRMPLAMLAEPGGGHFDVSDEKVEYLALYVKKAAQYRLPADAPVDHPIALNSIDPASAGWLVDRWRKDSPPKAPAAPVRQYKGTNSDAFWTFDEELAKATEAFHARFQRKKQQLVGYMQNGSVARQDPNTHQQVTLSFLPLQDGISFKLTGAFLDNVPEGRPERWTSLPKGSPISHAKDVVPVTVSRICGPVAQTASDTWAIRFYRMGLNNRRRSNEIWLLASHPGDAEYRRAVQQAVLHFPLRNTEGAAQKITFAEIPNQKVGTTAVELKATSDADVPVHYYVREGPAELDGCTLKFTKIPPRSRFPMKITVVAWQYGRSVEPELKSAEPVERSFAIVK